MIQVVYMNFIFILHSYHQIFHVMFIFLFKIFNLTLKYLNRGIEVNFSQFWRLWRSI